MDDAEQLAYRYLTSLGIGPVIYEPDGNVPPDFVVDERIAVEVRRLNQNHQQADGVYKSLEQLSIPLMQRLKRHLPTFGPSSSGECWYVCFDFQRPLDKWKALRPLLDSALEQFRTLAIRTPTAIQITPHFSIDLLKASVDHGSFYCLGAFSDNDSGGWVMAEVERNLQLCIAEKEGKIAPHRGKYREWWLVLSDFIDYGMDPEDHMVFREEVAPRLVHTFDKIILIDPRNHLRVVEI